MNNKIKKILDFRENADYKKLSCDEIAILKDYITNLQEKNEKLKKDLKTLWNICWNNDTEMTSYQNEVFDNYYDIFHKNGGKL